MKTLTQNNKLLKAALMLLFFSANTINSGFAFGIEDGKISKNELVKPAGNTELVNELLKSLEPEEPFSDEVGVQDEIQIFNNNDEVLFSGFQNEIKKDQKLVIMQRKAEFLFESNGTKVYKVF